MEHAGITAQDYESVKAKAQEMSISLKWALHQRRRYLDDMGIPIEWAPGEKEKYLEDSIRQHETDIAQAVRELASTGELEHRLIMDRIERAEKSIRHALFDLSKRKPNAGKGNGVDDTEIERAKAYPIESLLPNQVKRDMTLCPFHEDHYPSMSIKNNRAHCFSCNETWDAIALVMELKGLQFTEAVRYLVEMV